MTTKEKAISLIRTLSDDVALDDVIDRLYLLRKIELGIALADAGKVMEHAHCGPTCPNRLSGPSPRR